MEIAHAERGTDIVRRKGTAIRTERYGTRLEHASRQRDVRGDHDIARAGFTRDPVIGGIRARTYDDMTDRRIAARPETAIADNDDREAMPGCDPFDLVLHGTGIAVDENGEQAG